VVAFIPGTAAAYLVCGSGFGLSPSGVRAFFDYSNMHEERRSASDIPYNVPGIGDITG
jgi:hypothetical protein